MKFVNYLMLFTLAMVIWGCPTLSDSQLENIVKYAQGTQEFAKIPSNLTSKYVELHKEIKALRYTNKGLARKKITEGINDEIKEVIAVRRYGQEVDLTLKILKEYAKNLEKVASSDYFSKVQENSEKFGANIDTLIALYNTNNTDNPLPQGIGTLFNELIQFVGQSVINRKRTEYLMVNIQKADTLVVALHDQIQSFLDESVLHYWIDFLEKQLNICHNIIIDELKIVAKSPHNPSAFDLYQANLKVMELYEGIYELKLLAEELKKALKGLKKAHKAIIKNISKKQTLDSMLPEVASYLTRVSIIIDISNNIKEQDKKE